jgi:hypothetical protein
LSPRARPSTQSFIAKFSAFEGEHSTKAIKSVARKELDSPRGQCTLSLSTPRS